MKNWDIQTRVLKKKIMFSLWQKKTLNQEMQNSIESNKKISKNTNKNNYNNRIMWKKIMLKYEMSITLFKIKLSQESVMI